MTRPAIQECLTDAWRIKQPNSPMAVILFEQMLEATGYKVERGPGFQYWVTPDHRLTISGIRIDGTMYHWNHHDFRPIMSIWPPLYVE